MGDKVSAFRPYLELALSGTPLSGDDMGAAMDLIFAGAATDIEIAGFLAALRTRGETVEEIAAAAQAMRKNAIAVAAPDGVIDTCGAGGDGAQTFNISTAAALIAAGAGASVAKHGNRAVSSKSGSSDVIEALGVRLDLPPETISRCIREAGVGFIFAPLHHKAAGRAAAARKGLGARTLFNLLGPLSNPAGAKRQLMGVFSRDLARPIAHVMARLGVEAAWVVHGSDGLDELTTTGPSFVAALENGVVREFEIHPSDAQIGLARAADLRGGDVAHNAAAIRRLLDGEPGAFRDIAVLNAAGALVVAGKAKTLSRGARLAQEAIDSGAARGALQRLVEISNAAP
jgi:anthranilate phosphoribosyltransferase